MSLDRLLADKGLGGRPPSPLSVGGRSKDIVYDNRTLNKALKDRNFSIIFQLC